MKIISSHRHVSASVVHGYKRSTAEADEIGPGRWYLPRVFVQEEHRGQGLGSKLLQALLHACAEQGAKIVEVAPGGYNVDPVRQRNFYLKNGFKETKAPDLLIYEVNDSGNLQTGGTPILHPEELPQTVL